VGCRLNGDIAETGMLRNSGAKGKVIAIHLGQGVRYILDLPCAAVGKIAAYDCHGSYLSRREGADSVRAGTADQNLILHKS
jgi:hypothetical protein